jgi:hypothetical protein
MLGHWQNAGWSTKSAAEVAREATKSWKAAEKFVGMPPEQLIRVPKDVKDEVGWKAVWERLGKPKDAKEYDFSALKFSDGAALDEGFVNLMRDASYRFNLPKDTASAITAEFVKYLDGAETGEKAEREAKLIEQKAALKKNWGPNEAANLFVAQRTAAALGIAPETVAALEGVIGYDRIMEMFRTIGTKIGEDKFVQGTHQSQQAGGVMTAESAKARKADLMGDKVWVKSFLEGDPAKAREMTALNTILVAAGMGA